MDRVGHQGSAIALSGSGRAALSSSPSWCTNVMGTNRELSADADSVGVRRMASILIRKISASILLCSLVEGLPLSASSAILGSVFEPATARPLAPRAPLFLAAADQLNTKV